MNWDQVQGNWKEFKGNVQAKWGELISCTLLAGRLVLRHLHLDDYNTVPRNSPSGNRDRSFWMSNSRIGSTNFMRSNVSAAKA